MKKQFLALIGVLALFLSCKKELDLAIQDQECADFRIFNAQGSFQQPNAPGNISGNRININFQYDGVERCLATIHRTVTFTRCNGQEVTATVIDPEIVSVTDPSVSVGNPNVSFKIDFEMASAAEYNDICSVSIDFFTQNENEEDSNFLTVILPFPGKALPPPTNFNDTFTVRTLNLQVTLRDDAAEDGDIITIIVNGQVVANNVEIFNFPQTFNFTIDPTIANSITFYAVNEGSSSPNTVTGEINDGVTFPPPQFNRGLLQGQTVSYNLVYVP